MRKTRYAVAIALVGLAVVLTAGIAAVWPAAELRAVALVAVPVAIAAPLMVRYFEWRVTLHRRVLPEPGDAEEDATSARGAGMKLAEA